MTDNVELRVKYMRLIDIILRTLGPIGTPDDGPHKRGGVFHGLEGGPQPEPWAFSHTAVSKAVASEMVSAIRLLVMAEKAGNAGAQDRAMNRISAITDDWCGTMKIIVVSLNPQPLPPRDWWWDPDPIRRRDDLVSDMMAEIGGLQPGAVVDMAMDIAGRVMNEVR